MTVTLTLRRIDPARAYALVVGLFLLVRAVTTLAGGASFALPGDGWRAAAQLAVASMLLACGPRHRTARIAALATAVLYTAETVLGSLDGTTILGAIPVDTRDMIVHPALAVLAYAAYFASRSRP